MGAVESDLAREDVMQVVGSVAAGAWIADALQGLKPVRAGRFLVHGSHDREKAATAPVPEALISEKERLAREEETRRERAERAAPAEQAARGVPVRACK